MSTATAVVHPVVHPVVAPPDLAPMELVCQETFPTALDFKEAQESRATTLAPPPTRLTAPHTKPPPAREVPVAPVVPPIPVPSKDQVPVFQATASDINPHWIQCVPAVREWVQDCARDVWLSDAWVYGVMSFTDSFMQHEVVPKHRIQQVVCACMYVASATIDHEMLSVEYICNTFTKGIRVRDVITEMACFVAMRYHPGFDPFVGGNIVRTLGQGNSAVYAATFSQDPSHSTWALKRHDPLNRREVVTYQFIVDIRSLFLLRDHPNVAFLKGAFIAPDGCFMIMELYPTSFKEHFRADPKPNCPVIKRALRELINVLACAHAMGISHRDIKPPNIMFDAKGGLRLCDWDSSIVLNGQMRTTTNPICTLWYRSPEVAASPLDRDVPYDACALDIWSAGALVHDMVFHEPWTRANTEQLLVYHIKREYGDGASIPPVPFPREVERAMGTSGVHLLRQLLCVNPEKRITAANALKHPYFSE